MSELEPAHRRAGQMKASYDAGQQNAVVLYDSCSLDESEVLKVLHRTMPWWPFRSPRPVTFSGDRATFVGHEFWTIVDNQPKRFLVGISNNNVHGMSEDELEELLTKVVQGLRDMLNRKRLPKVDRHRRGRLYRKR